MHTWKQDLGSVTSTVTAHDILTANTDVIFLMHKHTYLSSTHKCKKCTQCYYRNLHISRVGICFAVLAEAEISLQGICQHCCCQSTQKKAP